jgi:peptidyl-prolyl cis-trans isomerase A (cyclophilin A)
MKIVVLLLVQLLPFVTVAFHVGLPVSTPTSSSQSTSVLFASTSNRRDVLAKSASTVVSTLLVSSQQSLAEGAGKIVQFELANLEDGSSGVVQIQLEPDWAPKGVARLEELVGIGFYQNCRFFRVLPGFVAQFGIAADPALQAKWKSNPIADDPVRVTNERGTVVFATAGPNTRTTQLFINTNPRGNGFLDKQGFSPIGRVIQGMDLVDKLYSGYGEGAPSGRGPSQGMIQAKGNSYLEEAFPKLTYIANAKFL